jgi:hypothetical protein
MEKMPPNEEEQVIIFEESTGEFQSTSFRTILSGYGRLPTFFINPALQRGFLTSFHVTRGESFGFLFPFPRAEAQGQ